MTDQWTIKGKKCLVTGATSGIGKVTARELASLGAHVIIVSRNEEKCKNTIREIQQDIGNRTLEYYVADLSVQQEIRDLVDRFAEQHDSLDALINNAGALFTSRKESTDGIEMTLALNHLNYFLLTNLLLEHLKNAPSARIINVASAAHHGATIDFEDLQKEEKYSGMNVYGQSKLANILFTYELDRRLQDEPITVNAMHPGFVGSNFGKNNGGLIKLAMSVMHIFARSPEEGADTAIYLASSPKVQEVSGKYFMDKRQKRSSEESYNEQMAKRLWEVSAELTGLTKPVVTSDNTKSPEGKDK